MHAVLLPISRLSEGARVRVAPGARASEAALLQEVDALLPPGRLDPVLLRRPVRVVVPERSLRIHLSAALARHRAATAGRALVGLSLHTLHALALEVLDRAGVSPPGSASAFDVLVRRFAREEPELARSLEHLADGYAAVATTVRDLIDAGLMSLHVDDIIERVHAPGIELGTPEERARAEALLRVAGRTLDEMDALDIGRAGALYQRADEVLAANPDSVLPCRAVLVAGFSSVSGVAGDFLTRLTNLFESVVIVDHPPDPAHPEQPDVGCAATSRLLERLRGLLHPGADWAPAHPPPELRLFSAAGAIEECREVASRVRELLDQGVRPESIGIVSRELAPYRVPLRSHLRRMGVPFSALGALGPAGGMGRRISAMLDLLRQGADAPMDRWLDALGPRGRVGARTLQPRRWRPVRLWDLRLALRALGATRVADVGRLDVDALLAGRDHYPLPVRHGLWELGALSGEDAGADEDGVAAEEQETSVRAIRRKLPEEILRTAARAAADLVTRFSEWPELAGVREHRDLLLTLLKDELGWDQNYLGMPPVFGALSALEREFPNRLPLRFDELVLLVARTLFDIGTEPLGGQGGGVAVLGASEARGRTFQHLFILGLNRDTFPRIVMEDPLLPDKVRRGLVEFLADLQLSSHAFDEERYLFASLVASSPAVTVSWQVVDDDNKARPPSPLVERLRLSQERLHGRAPEQIVPLHTRRDAGVAARVMPVEDHLMLAALSGQREQWGALLPLAMAEAISSLPALDLDAGRLAAARRNVLDEVDPDRDSREGRARAVGGGPYYGMVGPLVEGSPNFSKDPRRSPLYVTTVERMSGCPWQVFLERLLRLEQSPDPLQELPGVDERMVGNVTHTVLQRVVEAAMPTGPADLSAAVGSEGVMVSWPEPARVEEMLREAAEATLRDAGLALTGFVSALMERARPFVEAAQARDWDGLPVRVIGVELEGAVTVSDAAGRAREIRFKADRVDRAPDGTLRLTDYKTGGGPSAKTKGAERRHENLLKKVAAGQYLQAVAYARAVGQPGAEGRYLYLKPELEAEAREYAVREDEERFVGAFENAAQRVISAWDQGSFFPRLLEPDRDKEPARCKFCEVAQACNRGDSGARGRMRRWMRGARDREEQGQPLAADEAAILGVWGLGAKPAEETP